MNNPPTVVASPSAGFLSGKGGQIITQVQKSDGWHAVTSLAELTVACSDDGCTDLALGTESGMVRILPCVSG